MRERVGGRERERERETERERERERQRERGDTKAEQGQRRVAILICGWLTGLRIRHKAGACQGRDREAPHIRSLRQRPLKLTETDPRGFGTPEIRTWPGISPAVCLPLPLAGAVACSSRRPHVCLAWLCRSSQLNQFSACHGLSEPSRTQTTKPDMKLKRPATSQCFFPVAFDTPSAPETPAIA